MTLEPDLREQLAGRRAFGPAAPEQPGADTAERDVLGDAQRRDEAELLVDARDAGALRVPRAVQLDDSAVDLELALVRWDESGDDVDERALAGAVVAAQAADLARRDRQGDVSHRLDRAEALADALEVEPGRGGGRSGGGQSASLSAAAAMPAGRHDLPFEDLAGRSLRQLVDEPDVPWVLVRRDPRLHPLPELVRAGGGVRLEHDRRRRPLRPGAGRGRRPPRWRAPPGAGAGDPRARAGRC